MTIVIRLLTVLSLCALLVACDAPATATSTATEKDETASATGVPSNNQAQAQGETQAEAIVVEGPKLSSATVGSQGGTLRLTDEIGAVYSISFRDGGAWLHGVALLRGADRGWYDRGADKVPRALRNVGIGGSLGPHMVVVTPKADGVWVDDRLYVPLQEQNVALFDGAGESLLKVGLATLDSYLGPAPLDDARQRKALVQQRLRALLTSSKRIKALWAGT